MDNEVRSLIETWHWMYFETDLVLGGIAEEHLHQRPGPNLLAISEHLAHVARSEGSIICRFLLGQPPEAWQTSVLTRDVFGWPPTMLERPVDPDLASLPLAELTAEYLNLHERCYRAALALELPGDHAFDDAWDRVITVRDRLRIAAYHVAYHCGQIYSVRHMLGEDTPEN